MPRIPRIAEACLVVILRRHAMALAAHLLDLRCSHPSRIPRADARGLAHMCGGRSMTSLALDAFLGDRYIAIQEHRKRTRQWQAKHRRIIAEGS